MRQRDYEKASDFFRKVIEVEPYNASAHYNLATALGRSGKREEGQAEMNEFKRLQDLFGSTTVGLQYLEQGKYALAIDQIPENYLAQVAENDQNIEVTFKEVAAESGIEFIHDGPGKVSFKLDSPESIGKSIVPYFGSGISFSDIDQDGWLDIFAANAGNENSGGALLHNKGDGKFVSISETSGLNQKAQTMHAAWGDYDNDGYPDLYLINYGKNLLFLNQKDGTFKDVTDETGTGDPSWGMGGGFLDFDHDGDLDILVANFVDTDSGVPPNGKFPQDYPGKSNVLYQNNGNGTFTDISEKSKIGEPKEKTLAILASDLNNTRDLDLLFINLDSSNRIWNNLRDGTFRPTSDTGFENVTTSVAVGAGDFDQSGSIDLLFPSLLPGKTELYLNQGHDRFNASNSPLEPSAPFLNSQFFDFDNDGDLDVLAISVALFSDPENMTGGRNLYLFENRNGKLVDISSRTGLQEIKGKAVRGTSIGDYDNDGDLDFIVSVNGGRPLLFRNDGGNQNNWLSIRLVGTNSNKSGYGVKAEIKAGSQSQKSETFGSQGFLVQNSPFIHFGLGKSERVDVVRLLWPNGVLQSEIDRPVNQTIELQELDRKGTSCPIMYVWNGTSYRFQTDFLGGSAYGSLVAPGVYNYPDTDEYVKLNRQDLKLKDNRLFITMNNQLEEVILFDHLELVAVDHPEEFEVFPDEKLLPGPPYQSFQLFTAENPRPPLEAYDREGKSILQEITNQDRIYPTVPDTLPFKGYTSTQELTLDLGDVSNDYSVLLMYAWIDYADSSSNLAAAQAEIQLVPPYLQVMDENGHWVTVIERMGFPAGLPKTMTVDLSGKFLSSSRKVKIITNMKIFWDQILVESGKRRSDLRIHRALPEIADLRFRGYPEFSSPDNRLPKVYYYDRDSSAEWKTHVGAYTRFGDVRPLLANRDDMFVITRSGDEIEAAFDLGDLPPLPDGWVRDYLIYVDGFGKDMDPNSAAPNFLGPLPFHGMSSFPYPENESYPDTERYRKYLQEWNTRIVDRPIPNLPAAAKE
jgi:hypothetical protein